MAGRSQLPNPTRSSTRCVSSVVRTVVEPPSPEPSCPGMSRLPRASGLRPPRTYGSAPPAPCSPQYQTPPPSRLRPPQGRSGIRPPQASGLRPPRPVCRPPQTPVCAQRAPSPPRPRSPCAPPPPPAPCPAVSTPCAPAPCPTAAPPRASMGACERLLAEQSDQEAAVREALRAQWEASLQAFPDTPLNVSLRDAERRARAQEQQRHREACRARERAQIQLRQIMAAREQQRREYEEQCHSYNLTLEAIEEMLMEERDLMLREQQERLLRRAACNVCTEAQWRAAVGLADNWRREMLEAYQPYAEFQAKVFANKELWEKRKKKYRRSMQLPRAPLSPLRESQVDVFDDSPPCGAPPLLPERVFDVPPPCAPLTLMDMSPPCDVDLPPPLMRSFTLSPCPATSDDADGEEWYSEFDPIRDARRELTFDSEDDDSQMEGAVGGGCM